MSRASKLIQAALLMVLLPGCFHCEPQEDAKDKAPDISGYYSCKGVSGGKEYSGVVVVTRLHGQVYQFVWCVEEGAQTVGVGELRGKSLNVGWRQGSLSGVTSYGLEGASLKGRLVSFTPGQQGLETYEGKESLEFLMKAQAKDL